MIQETGVVVHNRRIRPAIFSLTLDLPAIARSARPGQFLHLLIPQAPGVLLRRPFSIAAVQGDQVELLIRIIGTGTETISQYSEGRSCDVIGPLGRSFNLDGLAQAVLVGGGIGAAPLLFLQDEIKNRKMDLRFFLGAKTHDEFPLADGDAQVRSIVCATDDGSYGEKGFVSIAFEKWQKTNQDGRLGVFSCGPISMLKAIQEICKKYRLHHQVSLENRMACGLGVCQGCAMPMKGGFKLVCKDGPVFNAEEVDWTQLKDF